MRILKITLALVNVGLLMFGFQNCGQLKFKQLAGSGQQTSIKEAASHPQSFDWGMNVTIDQREIVRFEGDQAYVNLNISAFISENRLTGLGDVSFFACAYDDNDSDKFIQRPGCIEIPLYGYLEEIVAYELFLSDLPIDAHQLFYNAYVTTDPEHFDPTVSTSYEFKLHDQEKVLSLQYPDESDDDGFGGGGPRGDWF